VATYLQQQLDALNWGHGSLGDGSGHTTCEMELEINKCDGEQNQCSEAR